MTNYADIFSLLEIDSARGSKTQADGTMLICPMPDIAPQAWLHKIFRPLPVSEFDELQGRVEIVIANEFRNFLLQANGLSIFSSAIAIFGLRKHYNRTSGDVQPFDLETSNKYERLRDAADHQLFIGSYFKDGSLLFIDQQTNKVFRCRQKSVKKIISSWENLHEMLLNETTHLRNEFVFG